MFCTVLDDKSTRRREIQLFTTGKVMLEVTIELDER